MARGLVRRRPGWHKTEWQFHGCIEERIELNKQGCGSESVEQLRASVIQFEIGGVAIVI